MKKSNINTYWVSLEISIVLVAVVGCIFGVFCGFSPDEIILDGLQEIGVCGQILLRTQVHLAQWPGRWKPLLVVGVIEVCAVPPDGSWLDCSAGPEDVLDTLRVVTIEGVPLSDVVIAAIARLVTNSGILFATSFGVHGCLLCSFSSEVVAVKVTVFRLLIKLLFNGLPEFVGLWLLISLFIPTASLALVLGIRG
jgi:hypothetical protein